MDFRSVNLILKGKNMLQNRNEFTLININTGAQVIITVQPMTLGNKENLDEWLRIVYLRQARQMGEPADKAEAEAERLDIIGNHFFLSESRWAARILYEFTVQKNTFDEFYNDFFNLKIWTFQPENEPDELFRFRKNIDTFKEAYTYACSNPTQPAADQPETAPTLGQA